MIFNRVYPLPDDESVWLDCYVADPLRNYTRKAILVLPGGGYAGVCSDREGEPIALAFLPYGFNAFVLNYSTGRKKPYPAQLIEACAAVKYIRSHADELNVDPQKIFATGFSAGGHLCASLGIFWNRPEVTSVLGDPAGYKPNGIMPVYAVISSDPAFIQKDTLFNLLCKDEPTQEELDYVSPEKHVTEDAAPLFMVHTSDDPVVDIRHALCLGAAYKRVGLPFELHVYPFGPHGVALGNAITAFGNPGWDDPEVAKWVAQAAAWANRF